MSKARLPPPTGPSITVGYDGSEASIAAMHWAASEALHREGTVQVVTCVDPHAGATTDRLLPDPRPVHRTAEWLMRSQAGSDRGPAAEFTFSVVRGPAELRLVDESADGALLVIGSGGHLLLGAWRLGAITHELLRHAVCPVVLVPDGYIAGGHDRIVVGVEDSTSHAALSWAATEAGRRNAELVIVHAHQAADESGAEADDHAASILADAARFAAQRGDARISTRTVDGPLAPSLLAQAFNADMLVVGARTARHDSAEPGSIARSVGACATSPTVIVQPGPAPVDRPPGPGAR